MEMVTKISRRAWEGFHVHDVPTVQAKLEIDCAIPALPHACCCELGFDLDSGRFARAWCRYQEMPNLSGGSFRKHEGIKHFLVSDDVIEVTVNTTTLGLMGSSMV